METQIGDYVLTKQIGAGTFAAVKLGYHKVIQLPVAVKIIPRNNFSDPDHIERFQREVNLIKEMDHPFIAEFYEVLEDENNFYVIMEYIENGNMLDFVNKNGELQENHARHYFCQLVSVLEYLHDTKKVAHRDLKAENVLLDRNNNIRLIDFGLSNMFTTQDPYLKTACGSPAYASPEMIKGQPYTILSDLWSAGILLYAMVNGELPFEDENMQRLLQKIIYTEPRYSNTISPQLKDLLQRMLTKDPSKRITLQKIKEHHWFSQYEYSAMMDSNFGIATNWRILDTPGNKLEIDREIVQEMTELGFDCSTLVNDLICNRTSRLTGVYRMMRKDKITDLMAEISLSRAPVKRGRQQTIGGTSVFPKAGPPRPSANMGNPLPSLAERRGSVSIPMRPTTVRNGSGVKLGVTKTGQYGEVSHSTPFTPGAQRIPVPSIQSPGHNPQASPLIPNPTAVGLRRSSIRPTAGPGVLQRKRSNSLREPQSAKPY